jgi:uncharacterized protein YndB with AHSA1/START domain
MGMEAVRETLRIARPIDEVWRAWTDPAWLCGWHAERVEGVLAPGREIRLAWDSLGVSLALEVVAMDAPARLVMRGAPPGRPPQTLAIDLAPTDGGAATDLAICHDGFLPGAGGEEERAGTAAGWHVAARVLAHYLARQAGRARASTAALAPVVAALDEVEPLFARPAWLLGDGAQLGDEGSGFTAPGVGLRGTVLARALPRQIALAVDGGAGVVVLRAIRLDPAPRGALLVGVQAWSWQPERPAHAALVAALEPAVGRLVAALAGARPGGVA